MALQISDNFKLGMKRPLDSRLSFDTIAEMRDYVEARLYNGIISYNNETKKFYTYDINNDVTLELNKWKELETGSVKTIEPVFDFEIENYKPLFEVGTAFPANNNLIVTLKDLEKTEAEINKINFYANDVLLESQDYVDGTVEYKYLLTNPTTVKTEFKAEVIYNAASKSFKILEIDFAFPTFYGVMNSVVVEQADLQNLNKVVQNKHQLVWDDVILDAQHFVYASPVAIGALISVKDDNENEYLLNSMVTSSKTFFVDGETVPYNIYALKDPATIKELDYTLYFDDDTPEDEVKVNIELPDNVQEILDTKINDAPLTIQKNGANVAVFTANSKTPTVANIEVPTLKVNSREVNNLDIYAPLASGNDGEVLVSSGAGKAPAWVDLLEDLEGMRSIKLNGQQNINPSFYAPVTSGASGQVLISNGVGNPPIWASGSSAVIDIAVKNFTWNYNSAYLQNSSILPNGGENFAASSSGFDNLPTADGPITKYSNSAQGIKINGQGKYLIEIFYTFDSSHITDYSSYEVGYVGNDSNEVINSNNPYTGSMTPDYYGNKQVMLYQKCHNTPFYISTINYTRNNGFPLVIYPYIAPNSNFSSNLIGSATMKITRLCDASMV